MGGRGPAETLVELNRVLAADIHAGLYVTMLYVIIDVARNELTLARGGHELPLVAVRQPGDGIVNARFIGSEGMALGLVPDEIYSAAVVNHTEPFSAGDVLVLCTDGVTEAPNDEGKEFSGARLADVVRQLHGQSARAVNDGIIEGVQRFTGKSAQRDDFTLVAVKRT